MGFLRSVVPQMGLPDGNILIGKSILVFVKIPLTQKKMSIKQWQIDFLSPVGGFATHTSNMKLQEKALFTIYNTNGVVLRSTK